MPRPFSTARLDALRSDSPRGLAPHSSRSTFFICIATLTPLPKKIGSCVNHGPPSSGTGKLACLWAVRAVDRVTNPAKALFSLQPQWLDAVAGRLVWPPLPKIGSCVNHGPPSSGTGHWRACGQRGVRRMQMQQYINTDGIGPQDRLSAGYWAKKQGLWRRAAIHLRWAEDFVCGERRGGLADEPEAYPARQSSPAAPEPVPAAPVSRGRRRERAELMCSTPRRHDQRLRHPIGC